MHSPYPLCRSILHPRLLRLASLQTTFLPASLMLATLFDANTKDGAPGTTHSPSSRASLTCCCCCILSIPGLLPSLHHAVAALADAKHERAAPMPHV